MRMTPEPVTPARLAFTPDGTPFSPEFGDVYHTADGALGQARHVFLQGNGLPRRWAGRHRFVILETGFGLGNNFLATWDAWRDDPARCDRLVYVSVEKHPLSRADMERVHSGSPLQALAAQLAARWPPATPDLHVLAFEDGRVELLLALGDAAWVLPQLQARVDAIYLDGFAPARNPQMWSPALLKRLGRLAAPGATAATWSTARVVRDGLAQAGFEAGTAPGFGRKRDMTVARFEPRHTAPPPAAFVQRDTPGHALVIGAGLAGSAAAQALAGQGWTCTVVAAATASPRPAGGIFHGTFNAPDSLHAQWHRAAALHLQRMLGPAIGSASLPGALSGLLRLDPRLDTAAARAQQAATGLPDTYVQWLDRDAARSASAVAVPCGGWWYPGGGWLAPQALVEHWLASPAGAIRHVTAAPVVRLERQGNLWAALDASGQALGAAPVVILACGAATAALLGRICRPLPVTASRGQATGLAPGCAGLSVPRVPVAGNGYAVPLREGGLLIGATTQWDDPQGDAREADHRHNLLQGAGLGVIDPAAIDALLAGPPPPVAYVGWRAVTPDRLPLIGPLPDRPAWDRARAAGHRADALHHLPRLHDAAGGLYVFSGLGSRGITHAALGARLLAAWITGTPCPVPARLRDAVDPARFELRQSRGPAPANTDDLQSSTPTDHP